MKNFVFIILLIQFTFTYGNFKTPPIGCVFCGFTVKFTLPTTTTTTTTPLYTNSALIKLAIDSYNKDNKGSYKLYKVNKLSFNQGLFHKRNYNLSIYMIEKSCKTILKGKKMCAVIKCDFVIETWFKDSKKQYRLLKSKCNSKKYIKYNSKQ